MAKEITTINELQGYLTNLTAVAPPTFQHLFRSQLQILNSIESPTLVDSSLTNIIDELYTALSECEDNPKQKKQLRRTFIGMIENLITFLDIQLAQSVKYDEEAALNAFTQAGNKFMDNLKALSLMAIESAGMVGNAAASTVDHIGRDAAVGVIGLGSEVAMGVAGSGFESSTSNSEDSTSQSSRKDSCSDATVDNMGSIARQTTNILDEHRGEYSREMSGHISNWTSAMSGIVIKNVFSPEQEEKRTQLIHSFYRAVTKDKRNAESQEKFFETLCNSMDKLEEYQEILGKSIIISELIKRYVRELEKHQSSSSSKPTTKKIFKLMTIAGPMFGGLGGAVSTGLTIYSYFQQKACNNTTPEEKILSYKQLAKSYMPDFSKDVFLAE